MGKVIGILSLKGGVGKTSTVLSMGSAMSELGKRVLLVDGNLSAPNLGVHLNVINPDVTIHHVLAGEESIRNSIIPMENFNFDIIPASIFYSREISPLKLRNKLRSVKDKYDVVILDSSPALNDETLAVMLASDELFVVTTPDYPTLSMTLKAIRDARSRGIRIDGLILNKVRNKKYELSLGDIEDTAEIPILAVVPEEPHVLESSARFVTPYFQKPKSRGSEEYRKLAAVSVGEKYEPTGPRRFMRFKVTPKRQEINRELFYDRIFE